MTEEPQRQTKEITVADLFPMLAENELNEAREALDAYCDLLLRIFERLERGRRADFDEDSLGSYNLGKGRFP
jgi:hypothetical protein